MKWTDYREKLGIGLDDQEKTRKVTKSILIGLEYKDAQFSDEELMHFLMTIGEPTRYLNEKNGKVVYHMLCDVQGDFKVFLSYYIAMMNCESATSMKEYYHDLLTEQLAQFGIAYETVNDNDGVFILPKGAPELDDGLISEPLEWLNEYPDARKLFVKAMRMYDNATEETASDVVDAFRKALECFFQMFFSGKKGLENYKADYAEYLKSHGVAQAIANNLVILLQQYIAYDNSFAKHQSRANTCTLEYCMYQTLNIVRLVIMLKKGDE